MRWPGGVRALAGALCLYCLFLGVLAAFAPRTFYDDFPFAAHWVDKLPPYNEHFVTDVGGLYLGFAVLFGWAARRPERTLVRAASVAFLVPAVLHLVFHAGHLHGFATGDAIAEVGGLAGLLLLPIGAFWGAGGR